MNRTEALYAQELEAYKVIGEIAWYGFEAMNLKLADKTYYRPDFAVLRPDGKLEFHEVKRAGANWSGWEDDARVKIKIAAKLFPFKFVAAKRVKGQWETETWNG